MKFARLPAMFAFLFILAPGVSGHCPLCTLGAMAASGIAAYLGVNNAVIGVFVGAFAASVGYWISRLIKKQYFRYQEMAMVLFSFATTVLPLLMVMTQVKAVYIGLSGDYGSLLNRTYVINLFLAGSIIGAIIVAASPCLSSKLTEIRKGKFIQFQGIIINFIALAIVAAILQVLL